MFKQKFEDIIHDLRTNEATKDQIVYWREIAAKEARTVPFPESLDNRIQKALQKRGIDALYTHQQTAFAHAEKGNDFVAVTPTASGKTLCYNLPVLSRILENEESRALYLFPTKALAQDQNSELNELITDVGLDVKCFTYDGDTSPTIRHAVRKAGHVVITNPDMLHAAILPHHTKWVAFFENLNYIVIDELHTYRGVFGSHVANVIQR